MKKGDLLNAIVGDFVVCASAPSTPRGDAMWEVACQCCGRHYMMRATDIRKALREGRSARLCDCKKPDFMREVMKKRLEATAKERAKRKAEKEAKRAREIAERKQSALDYHIYKEDHANIYYAWCSMKARCLRETHKKFKHYGGRGISVCNEWLHDFRAFCEWSLSNGYQSGLSIDRIDNDKGYSPDNCRWTTAKVQNNNKRSRERVLNDLRAHGYL